MSQKGLEPQDRKLIARYMLVNVAMLLMVGVVVAVGHLRGDAGKTAQTTKGPVQNSGTCAPALASK